MKKLIITVLMAVCATTNVLAQEKTDYKQGLENFGNKVKELWHSPQIEATKDWAKNDVTPLFVGTAKEGAGMAYDVVVSPEAACRLFWDNASYVTSKPVFNQKGTQAFETAIKNMPHDQAMQKLADMGLLIRKIDPNWEEKQVIEKVENIPLDEVSERLESYFAGQGYENKFRCASENIKGDFLTSVESYISTLEEVKFIGARGQYNNVKETLKIK